MRRLLQRTDAAGGAVRDAAGVSARSGERLAPMTHSSCAGVVAVALLASCCGTLFPGLCPTCPPALVPALLPAPPSGAHSWSSVSARFSSSWVRAARSRCSASAAVISPRSRSRSSARPFSCARCCSSCCRISALRALPVCCVACAMLCERAQRGWRGGASQRGAGVQASMAGEPCAKLPWVGEYDHCLPLLSLATTRSQKKAPEQRTSSICCMSR